MAISAKTITVRMTLDTSDFSRGISRVNSQLNTVGTTGVGVADTLRGAFATIVGGATVASIVTMSDELTGMQNRLRAVTDNQGEFNTAMDQITAIAQRSRNGLTEVGDLYSKVALAGEQMGLSQGQVAQTTETFAKALKLSGAGAAQSSAAILQFGQALASGKMQGDEFRSLMENSPIFMRKLSAALGVSQGDLRKLATEGKLTSDVIIAATGEMAASVDSEFGQTVPTIGEAFVNLRNNIMLMFAEIEQRTGIFTTIREALFALGNNIGTVFKFIGAMLAFAFGVRAVAMIMNFVKALQVLRAATKAQTIAQAALLALGGPAGLAALAAGAAAAAAAYVALDRIIPDTVDVGTATGSDLGEAPTGPSAQELLQQASARADGERTRARAARTAAREAETRRRQAEAEARRNRQRVAENIAEIRAETQAKAAQLALDIRLIGMSDEYAQIERERLAITTEQTKKIAELKALTLSTNPAENARMQAEEERKINEEYAIRLAALADLITQQRRQTEEAGRLALVSTQAAIKLSLAEVQARTENLGVFLDYERTFNADRIKINTEAQNAIDDVMAKSAGMDSQVLAGKLANIEAEKQARLAGIAAVRDAEARYFEASRTAAQGIADAQNEAFLRMTDQAAFAKNIFNTAMNGFTDAIVRFAETGKLSFKDLFRSLMIELIKMQANKLFLSMFGKGGAMGSLFAGFFSQGGFIPSGKFGIAGESGPEIIRGPAYVTSATKTAQMLGGSGGSMMPRDTVVNYNINAVDARSFQQLVAQNPEFIYNVSQRGARRLPR